MSRKRENKYYYKDGTISSRHYGMKILHRLDGPAAERIDHHKAWLINGRYHRLDGPAVEWANGTKCWYVDGKYHRIDGSAMECANGDRAWYVDGRLHRLDGPAIEWANGDKQWYVDGEEHTEKQFNELIKEINEMNVAMKLTDPRQWVRKLINI
jgi:hypothetical protein